MATNTIPFEPKGPVTPGRWIGMGWAVVRQDLGNFVLITLIAGALWIAVGFTVVGHFLVGGPLITGLFIATRRGMLEGRIEVSDLFSGFSLFVDSLLVCLIVTVFQLVGFVLCILPFFLVTAFYLFPYLFLADRKLSFWDAMEASRKTTARDILGYMVFVFLLVLLNLVGLMLAGAGLLVTIPVSVAAIATAYGEVVGFEPRPPAPHGPVIIP